MVWVRIWKITPKIFSFFFPSGQKKLLQFGSGNTRVKAGSASYLLQVKSNLGSGQGPSLDLCEGVKRGGSTIGTRSSVDQVYIALKNKICGNEKPGQESVLK